MASQDPSGSIPLVHAPTGQGYKLLELTPELLELLESENPPTLTLQPSATAAVLKTPDDKTYSLRQKNTSNALILLEPTSSPQAGGVLPVTRLRAIATVHETIELVPEVGEAPALRAKGRWHEKFGRGR